MSVVAVHMWEDQRRHTGMENIDGVPLGITATVALIAPTSSISEERPTKKRTTQRIQRKIVRAATVS